MSNAALRLELQAERRAGEMLATTQLKNGDPGHTMLPGLADLGVTKKESSRWQALAAIPDDEFVAAVAAAVAYSGRQPHR